MFFRQILPNLRPKLNRAIQDERFLTRFKTFRTSLQEIHGVEYPVQHPLGFVELMFLCPDHSYPEYLV